MRNDPSDCNSYLEEHAKTNYDNHFGSIVHPLESGDEALASWPETSVLLRRKLLLSLGDMEESSV